MICWFNKQILEIITRRHKAVFGVAHSSNSLFVQSLALLLAQILGAHLQFRRAPRAALIPSPILHDCVRTATHTMQLPISRNSVVFRALVHLAVFSAQDPVCAHIGKRRWVGREEYIGVEEWRWVEWRWVEHLSGWMNVQVEELSVLWLDWMNELVMS